MLGFFAPFEIAWPIYKGLDFKIRNGKGGLAGEADSEDTLPKSGGSVPSSSKFSR